MSLQKETTKLNKDKKNDDEFSFNLDEDIPIKLINNGLGFHQEEQMEKYLHTFKPNTSSNGLGIGIGGNGSRSQRQRLTQSGLGLGMSSRPGPMINGGRSSSSTTKTATAPATVPAPVTATTTTAIAPATATATAKKSIQLAAFAIDLTIIFVAELITVLVFYLVVKLQFPNFEIVKPIQELFMLLLSSTSTTSINLNLFLNSLHAEIIIYLFGIFLIYYFFYFAFLDLTKRGTVGKSIFKLKLVNSSYEMQSRLEIHVVLLRSLIVLSSALALWLPLLFDFQGKLSSSRVICLKHVGK
ncbi:MAG: RDD family protein [Oligoflexia bacterium]|nr:RDD family protein [Oligoflexia bacterium]